MALFECFPGFLRFGVGPFVDAEAHFWPLAMIVPLLVPPMVVRGCKMGPKYGPLASSQGSEPWAPVS